MLSRMTHQHTVLRRALLTQSGLMARAASVFHCMRVTLAMQAWVGTCISLPLS